MSTRAVLLVGHGTISDVRDVPEFLRRIRRGRPATPEFVEEVRRRYSLIGGSPLLSVTQSVSALLQARLGMPCHVAMRFWDPLVADVLRRLRDSSVQELCILPLAPYSVSMYVDVVAEALSALGPPSPALVPVEKYGEDRALIEAHAGKIAPLLSARNPRDTELVLTAHSLPVRVLAAGDTYQVEFEASARLVARALSWPATLAYQSQGEGGGEWLGPTLFEALSSAHKRGKRTVVVAPVGFLGDHVETLYDLDIEAAKQARELGLEFVRAPALNDDPAFVGALEGVVRRAFAAVGR